MIRHKLIFILTSTLLAGVCCSPEDCSTIVTAAELSPSQMVFHFNQLPNFQTQNQMAIFFTHPVTGIESDYFSARSKDLNEWLLSPLSNSTPADGGEANTAFTVTYDANTIKIMKIAMAEKVICVDRKASLPSPCGLRVPLDLNPDRILQATATWSTGRNYLVSIPSYPSFVGYVIDLFFTKPVNGIILPTDQYKTKRITDTHFVVTREWTEEACVKLVKFLLVMSFEKVSDIKALLLNGEPLIGHGESAAFFRNHEVDEAVTNDCNTFLEKRGDPWHGGEIARPLWFKADFGTGRAQVGLVVDFVFQEDIKELRLWELRVSNVSGNHWRVWNEGLSIPSNGTVKFPFAIYYYKHFHVPIIGIRVNDQVLCGLAAQTKLLMKEGNSEEKIRMNADISRLESLYLTMFASILLISSTILLTVVIFACILVRTLKDTYRNRRHLYDFPEKEPPVDLGHVNASCNDEQGEADCVSHM